MSCPGFYHIATIYLLPPFFPFFSSTASPFFVTARFSLLFPNCDVGLSHPAVTGPSTAWIRALYPCATLQWCNDRAMAPPPSPPPLFLSSRTRRVNFLQIGILLQFASSSIILAPPRSPRSRLKLLFMPPLSIPRSSPRTLLT